MANNIKLANALRKIGRSEPARNQGINITLNLDMSSFARAMRDMTNKKEGEEQEFQKTEGLTPNVS